MSGTPASGPPPGGMLLPIPSVIVTMRSTPGTVKCSTLPLGQCTSMSSTCDSNLEVPLRAAQPTVQELLQEREITYRNLLAAYLRLQEVNRQKTVFLASAAHELKTPLAVIKGYYDLLLSGSLGKLTDKQRDILQESKESCERLVRLVSMFLNYSALESGKLVLHLRENDLRDCLGELATPLAGGISAQARAAGMPLDPRPADLSSSIIRKCSRPSRICWTTRLKHTPAGGT